MTFSVMLLNGTCGYAGLEAFVNRNSIVDLTENELAYHIPGTIRFIHPMRYQRESFVEISGELDEDDPLKDFSAYILDPLNWDPTQFVERRFQYQADLGIKQQGRFLGGRHTIRMGLETHAQEALVNYVSGSHTPSNTTTPPLNLFDVRYAPYLTWQAHPRDWLSLTAHARVQFLHFDIHEVCRTTCSLQPNRTQRNIIPSFYADFRLYPFPNSEIFIKVGTGKHSFEDRESIGSTAVEQLTQTTSYEAGFHIHPREEFNMATSFWHVNLASDRVFLEEGDEVLRTGASIRQGIHVSMELKPVKELSFRGGWIFSRSRLNQTDRTLPLIPAWEAHTAVTSQWGEKWSSTVQMRYIEKRTDSDNQQSLRSFTTFDFITHFRLQDQFEHYSGHLTFGVLNLTNSNRPPYTIRIDFTTECRIAPSVSSQLLSRTSPNHCWCHHMGILMRGQNRSSQIYNTPGKSLRSQTWIVES